jgi:methylglyoxal synthase
MVPEVAVIVVVPGVPVVATPPLFTVAITVADEVHVTMLVRVCVAPLL